MKVYLSIVLLAALTWRCGLMDRSEGAPTPPGPELDAAIAHGRVLYRANGCAVCHGPEGRGDGVSAASLHPAPRDFRDLKAYVQGTSAINIAATIASGVRTGRPQMPAFSHLSEHERRALGEFIVSLQGQQDVTRR